MSKGCVRATPPCCSMFPLSGGMTQHDMFLSSASSQDRKNFSTQFFYFAQRHWILSYLWPPCFSWTFWNAGWLNYHHKMLNKFQWNKKRWQALVFINDKANFITNCTGIAKGISTDQRKKKKSLVIRLTAMSSGFSHSEFLQMLILIIFGDRYPVTGNASLYFVTQTVLLQGILNEPHIPWGWRVKINSSVLLRYF